MDVCTCLQKLKLCRVLSAATADKNGAPQIRCVSAVHYETDRLYFFTARGKAFCDELLSDGRVQLLACTESDEMIRLSGRAVPAAEQEEKIDTIFAEQPYLAELYPDDTRNIGIIFELSSFTVEYFNLGERPIFRQTYSVGQTAEPNIYRITEACIGCGRCLERCPQRCILPGERYTIRQEHCLHCGACYECCPAGAVMKP